MPRLFLPANSTVTRGSLSHRSSFTTWPCMTMVSPGTLGACSLNLRVRRRLPASRPVTQVARAQAAGGEDIHEDIGHRGGFGGGQVMVHVGEILCRQRPADDEQVGDGNCQFRQGLALVQ